MLCASENGSPGLFDFFYMRIIIQCCPRFWKGTSAVSVLSFDWRKHKSAVWWGDSPVWVSIMWPVAVITDYRVNKFFFLQENVWRARTSGGNNKVCVLPRWPYWKPIATDLSFKVSPTNKYIPIALHWKQLICRTEDSLNNVCLTVKILTWFILSKHRHVKVGQV